MMVYKQTYTLQKGYSPPSVGAQCLSKVQKLNYHWNLGLHNPARQDITFPQGYKDFRQWTQSCNICIPTHKMVTCVQQYHVPPTPSWENYTHSTAKLSLQPQANHQRAT